MIKLWETIHELEIIAFKLRTLQEVYEGLELKMEDNAAQDVNALWYLNECLVREVESLEKQTEAIYGAYYATEKEEERETA